MNRAEFERGWSSGLPETPCGSGSTLESTKNQRIWLKAIAWKYGINSVVDIGAGDMNWQPMIGWDVNYRAFDLVPRSPKVAEFDLRWHVPPAADAVMCLWVLNHLPIGDRIRALENLYASPAKYLIVTDRRSWKHPELPHIECLALDDSGGSRLLLCEL